MSYTTHIKWTSVGESWPSEGEPVLCCDWQSNIFIGKHNGKTWRGESGKQVWPTYWADVITPHEAIREAA